MELAQRQAQPGELWLADRNFSTRHILCGLHGQGSSFIVREHGRTPNPQPLAPVQYRGRIEAGAVYEQAVEVEDIRDNVCGCVGWNCIWSALLRMATQRSGC